MWGEDIIQIMYDVPNNRIQVWKFEGKAWMQVGKDIPVKFVDGDVFTVYAGKDGTVEIYRDEKLLSTRQPLEVRIPILTALPSLTPTLIATETPVLKDASVPQLANIVPINFKLPAPVSVPQQQSGAVTIDYVYDPLYRLTSADYSTGNDYLYTYDAVGNRLTQQVGLVTTNYVYDNANRLTSVDSITYTWDNNGNLLNDGVNTYVYDSANRLTSFNGTSSYAYNGMGDRLQQMVNGNTTTYTLDLNTGLTQVLNDGTNSYLYGVGRIAQVNTTTEYFLGDALGSVRQITDASGEITLAKSYQPYGETLASVGNGSSPFAFTGEQQDVSGLTYLRARYYSSGDGRFTSKDTWMGDYNSPLSLNRWGYVEGNPVNRIDPTGQRAWCPAGWTQQAIRWRVNVAEKYVYHTSDPMDTYVAAGIAIQCAGTNINQSLWYSGKGIAQITEAQTFTEWGKPIYQYDWFHGCYVYEREDEWPNKYKLENGHLVYVIRGYGLRKPEDEAPLNPNNVRDAVELMKREIQLVTGACGSKCTPTDIYVAAALAQNGPGFTFVGMQGIPNITPRIKKQYGVPDARINKDWFTYFADDALDHNMVNTKTQLNRFILVVNELQRRRWIVPYIDTTVIDKLKNWQE